MATGWASVLREQLGDRRLRLTDAQRRRLAIRGKTIGRKALMEVACIITPDTILRWYGTSGRRDMGDRYDILTEQELASHQVRKEVRQLIDRFVESPRAPADKQHINILDWGCGRGASVARLLDQGFNAYGVEIDSKVLESGYPLFRERGCDPCEIIMHVEETRRFPDGFFSIIFSEEVLEHVENIDEVAREMSRLTRPGESGVHLFPGSRRVVEPHLFMPFVHWLPKSSKRRWLIAAFLLLRMGPRWPWLDGAGIWKASDAYRSYLDEHTHYRETMLVLEAFCAAGFETAYETSDSRANRWAPDCLRKNGFPGGGITLITSKPSIRAAHATKNARAPDGGRNPDTP